MTVASSSSGDWSSSGEAFKAKRRNAPSKPLAGVQVVATLFALRIGYRLAKSAVGKLFSEPKIIPVSDQGNHAGEVLQQVPLADDEAGATACEQWVVCPLTAPAVPDGFKLMASEHLPISTYHFYEQFLSVETTCLQDHHTSTGQYNFTASRWKGPEGEDYHFSRVLDFWQPKKGMSPANAHCVQQQRFSVHPGGVFVMQTDMHMEHIPYADCFSVRSFWKAEPDSTGVGTNVSVHVAVPFSKGCLVKGIITKTTLSDCKAFYCDFLAKVQNSIATELLPQAAAAAAASEQLLGASPAAGAGRGSPFAAVDAEVFVRTTSHDSACSSPGRQNHHNHQQQQHKGWWPFRHHQEQQQQQQQQAQHARLAAGHSSSVRQLSRAVSAKPSFAQPISELKLVGRTTPAHEFISTAQVVLVLLVLLVQLLSLYDNLQLHHKLAAAMSSSC